MALTRIKARPALLPQAAEIRHGNEIIMQIEPQIRFRGMEPSPSVEEVVRERIARLGRFCDRITSCVVV